MPTLKRKLGNIGERIAVRYLKDQGYKILDRNYQKKWGEIDIVVLQGRSPGDSPQECVLVFVEVKTKGRTKGDSPQDYSPEENIHWQKQKRLIRTAQTYLLEKHYPSETNWQIDTIAVELDFEKRRANLRHIKDAVWNR